MAETLSFSTGLPMSEQEYAERCRTFTVSGVAKGAGADGNAIHFSN